MTPSRLLAVLLSFVPATVVAAERPAKPNILLILADDMGFSDLGCYGSEIKTPNLDKLARDGVRLSQFYVTPRCCPTRASLLTGLYPHQAGVGFMNDDAGHPAYRGELNDRCATVAELLRDLAGYRTAMLGKWHLSHVTISEPGPRAKRLLNFEEDAPISPSTLSWPVNRGFQTHIGTIPGVQNFFDPYGLVHNEQPITPPLDDFYYTDFLTEQAVDQINKLADGDRPFFMYLAHIAPHWPMQAREEDIAAYADTYQVGWDKIREDRLKRQIELGVVKPGTELSPRPDNRKNLNEGSSKLCAWDDAPDKAWQARRMAVYAAMISRLDEGVGRIMGTLRDKGIADNTVVIFLSDNGACAENVRPNWYDIPSKTRAGEAIRVGNDPKLMPGSDQTVYQSYGPAWANASNTPWRSFKHFMHEGGISTPFIVRYPDRLKAGGRINHSVVGHVIDVMPTLLELAGAAYPKEYQGRELTPVEGVSLVPALFRGESVPERPLFWEHEGNRAVRVGDLKLVANHNQAWELYDIANDRTESRNLVGEMPDKARELQELYRGWEKRAGVQPWPVKR